MYVNKIQLAFFSSLATLARAYIEYTIDYATSNAVVRHRSRAIAYRIFSIRLFARCLIDVSSLSKLIHLFLSSV